jgi:hypothetical protein
MKFVSFMDVLSDVQAVGRALERRRIAAVQWLNGQSAGRQALVGRGILNTSINRNSSNSLFRPISGRLEPNPCRRQHPNEWVSACQPQGITLKCRAS